MKRIHRGNVTGLTIVALAMVLIGAGNAGAINVEVFSGFTCCSGSGTPYSDLAGTFQSPDIQFGTATSFNWHPFGLESFGARLTGSLGVASDGMHTFTLCSDDGSLLFIDGTLVIDNGGDHGPQCIEGSAALTAGTHSFEVQFFECCGGPSGVDLLLPEGVTYQEGGGVTALSDAHLWVGLKNGDDSGTQFDLMVELLNNGDVVASGLTRCITGLVRNPVKAKEVIVPWGGFSEVPVAPLDELSLRVSTRIGTKPDGTKCSGLGGGHSAAVGLRLYYDSASRNSRFDMTVAPDPSRDLYLDSDGGVCPGGGGSSPGVTSRELSTTVPTEVTAKCKDSSAVNIAGGNAFKEIGTWRLIPLVP
jgi:hypothetical protein